MAAMERAPMLLSGFELLEKELKQLKNVDRHRIIKAIEVAREHGDLSENAEYHAAKDEQGLTEARIAELEDRISRSEVIDPTTLAGDRVVFGATVTMLDEDDKKVVYQIVGLEEADVKAGRISYSSPLARALIGRSKGDDAEVNTPSGEKFYEITKIEFK
jgi:transcription elongation factor GreA